MQHLSFKSPLPYSIFYVLLSVSERKKKTKNILIRCKKYRKLLKSNVNLRVECRCIVSKFKYCLPSNTYEIPTIQYLTGGKATYLYAIYFSIQMAKGGKLNTAICLKKNSLYSYICKTNFLHFLKNTLMYLVNQTIWRNSTKIVL